MLKNADLAPAIALAYLTGILPVVRDKVQPKLNVFKEFTMAGSGRLAEFVGFSAEETKALGDEHGIDFEQCRHWYDGYNIDGIEIYNPVVEAVDEGIIENCKLDWRTASFMTRVKNKNRLQLFPFWRFILP